MSNDDYRDPHAFDLVTGDEGDAVTTIAGRLDAQIDTSAIAIVESYDLTSQKMQATPVVNGRLAGRPSQAPPIPNMPVVYPAGGGYSITWPVAAGDFVKVDAASRSHDEWKASQGQLGTITPRDPRRHDLQDGLVTPGGRPLGAPLLSVEDGALLLGTDHYSNPESTDPVLQLRVKTGEKVTLRRTKSGDPVAEVGVEDDGTVFMERDGARVQISTSGVITANAGSSIVEVDDAGARLKNGDTKVEVNDSGKLILGEPDTVAPLLGPAELVAIVDDLLEALTVDAIDPPDKADLIARIARIKV